MLTRSLDDQELTSIAALAAEQRARIHLEQYDLAVDHLLARPRRGPLPQDLLHSLIAALHGARRVFLDGTEVIVSNEPLVPRAVVEDQGDSVRVTLDLEPHDLLGGGAVLRG